VQRMPPSDLPKEHRQLLLALRIFGDPARFDAHRLEAKKKGVGLPKVFSKYLSSNRDQSVPQDLIFHLRQIWKESLALADDETPVLLDCMAGGGTIPRGGVRYGLKLFANELTPVAAIILKAPFEYPARFGRTLSRHIADSARLVADRLRTRLARFSPFPPVDEWWPDVE